MKGFDLRESLVSKALELADSEKGKYNHYCKALDGDCVERECLCCPYSGLHSGQTSTCPDCGMVYCTSCGEQHEECCPAVDYHRYSSKCCSRCGSYFCWNCAQHYEEGRYSYTICPICGMYSYGHYPTFTLHT